VTWGVDFTSRARSDLVGLHPDEHEAIIDSLVAWSNEGPPHDHGRTLIGITFFEATVADRYLLAYTIDEVRQRFVVMWVREKPGLMCP
jgi:hypothetical protein